MRKIMLVIDDFNELRTFESLLRRVGFDVLSVSKEVLVNDALMKFHAEIVLATAKGRAVDGFRLATRLSKLPTPPRVALIFSPGTTTQSMESLDGLVDAIIKTPLQPALLLKVLAQLGGLDGDWILSKYEKLKSLHPDIVAPLHVSGGGEASESISVTGAGTHSDSVTFVKGKDGIYDSAETDESLAWPEGKAATARSARSDRYDKFLSGTNDVVDQVLPRDLSQAAMKKLKEASAPEREALDKIDREKRAFVDAMFIDKKES
jgi:CheY-like chemotaxis protein